MEILKAKVLISVWVASRDSKHASLRFIALQIPHSIPCGFPTGHGVRFSKPAGEHRRANGKRHKWCHTAHRAPNNR